MSSHISKLVDIDKFLATTSLLFYQI